MKRIGVLTGGGDAPGLNAVIRAVVKTAHGEYGCEVLGIKDGFDGLLDQHGIEKLTPKSVRGILPRGGTILGTANRGNPFARKVIRDGIEVIEDVSDVVVDRFHELNLDCLIVVGGDGTLHITHELFEKGCQVVGVPKTIDNDVGGTDVTFGFDTALNTATEAIDRLHTTAEAHHRIHISHAAHQRSGGLAEQLVAYVMTQGIVHQLEPVQVQKYHANVGLVSLRPGDRLLKSILEQRPVGQAGQGVVVRLLVQALFPACI